MPICCPKTPSTQVALIVRQYPSAAGHEFFISVETADLAKICGFVRLRLPPRSADRIFPELDGCALIRELHVYGQLIATSDKGAYHAQNVGFGSRLLIAAEEISQQHGFRRMAVISGVGVRRYYEKLGYHLEGEGKFMIKDFPPSSIDLTARSLWKWFPSDSNGEHWTLWRSSDGQRVLEETASRTRLVRQQMEPDHHHRKLAVSIGICLLALLIAFYMKS